MSEKRDNSGALFKNDRAGKSENFPVYGGSATIGGVDYFVSGWIKDGKSGKFISLAFKPKDKQSKPAKKDEPEFVDDDLPF